MDSNRGCDVCGAPATSAAKDVWRYSNWRSGYDEYYTSGNMKLGCDAHLVESIEYETRTPPPTREVK